MRYNTNLICRTHTQQIDVTEQKWFKHIMPLFLLCFVTLCLQTCCICCHIIDLLIFVIAVLTHWGRDKMADIFQTTFSNAFSCLKMYEFGLKFYWNFFAKVRINTIPALVQIMAIRTLHDCPSQMNENLLISNSKLTSDSELIWWR